MTDKLPANLLQLFTPRPAPRFIKPDDHDPEKRHTAFITPMGNYLQAFKEYKENDTSVPTESHMQARDRKKREKKEGTRRNITEGLANYKPKEDPNIKGDPFKTLFVARIDWNAEQRDLEKEFGRYGPILRMRIVKNINAAEGASQKKQNRGYAFIEYEREKDMKAAYKESDGVRIRERRVKVDCERGRTVKDWKPRRFGGGLGGRNYTKAPARPPPAAFGGPPMGPGGGRGGGFRGGFRGGFDGPRGGGGFRGGRGGFGGRGGIGYQGGGFGGPPDGAPMGPRGPRGGGFGGGGAGRFDDRPNGFGAGGTGSNMEPVRSSRYDDRDRYGGGRDFDRKRRHDDDYDDPRKRRY